MYAAVEAARAGKGTTLPFPLPAPYAALAQLILATLAVVAAAACWASRRLLGRPGRMAVGCALILTTPVFALGMTVLPIYFVPLASGSGLESATGLAHALLSTALTSCLVLVGLSYRRRLAGACPRCGHRHTGGHDAPLVHPDASTATRRTRTPAYLLMCGVLPWATAKTIWTLGGDALGITAERWQESNSGGSEMSKALASVGIDVTVLAAGLGFFLVAGLMYPWGQVFPRWTLVLSGRRVPRLLPLVPALLTAVGLSVYGVFLLVYAPLAALGVVPFPEPDPELGGTRSGTLWLAAFGGMAFGGLGFGLLTAARSYAARTRPICATATAPESPPTDTAGTEIPIESPRAEPPAYAGPVDQKSTAGLRPHRRSG
ncbi:hypothetical protein SSP35_31_00130 [Streptomyces sp. NBRC 110611]|uniref:hypothetical protein n=1 Tax=Streptomyces sp. NBRC 110611 TaxID=1621259 RepID=UPI0008358936|nr:hypothetical protein [Streptomyces sp. NBRC 110611]GAU71248.1 hypothetical protein SSP35_31_00130 [Streptomyces sp. NBRC 110611]